jgi:hypothetical protein
VSEQESLSEKQLAEDLFAEVFSDQPKSVGEALAVADAPEQEEQPEALPEPTGPEAAPIIVTDEPVQQEGLPVEAPDLPPSDEPGRDDEKEEEEQLAEAEDLPHIAWAKKKYGDDPDKWAKAAFDQEQMISRQGGQLKEAQQVGGQWYEYAMNLEQQLQQAQMAHQAEMPLSAAEEEWIESNMANPLGAAMQAAFNGNFGLYDGVLTAVAQDNPQMAAGIAQQVQQALYQAQQNAEAQAQPPDIKEQLAASVARLGIDVPTYGEQMMAKIEELGQDHPFVETILTGEDQARDVAMLAVLDLVRTGSTVTRRVKEDERGAAIKREAELRRAASGVVTGAPHTPPPKTDAFMDAMEQEWRAKGQWASEE